MAQAGFFNNGGRWYFQNSSGSFAHVPPPGANATKLTIVPAGFAGWLQQENARKAAAAAPAAQAPQQQAAPQEEAAPVQQNPVPAMAGDGQLIDDEAQIQRDRDNALGDLDARVGRMRVQWNDAQHDLRKNADDSFYGSNASLAARGITGQQNTASADQELATQAMRARQAAQAELDPDETNPMAAGYAIGQQRRDIKNGSLDSYRAAKLNAAGRRQATGDEYPVAAPGVAAAAPQPVAAAPRVAPAAVVKPRVATHVKGFYQQGGKVYYQNAAGKTAATKKSWGQVSAPKRIKPGKRL